MACADVALVRFFVNDVADAAALDRFARQLGFAPPAVTVMALPSWLCAVLPASLHKLARLVWFALHLRRAEAILAAERTSTLLARWPGRGPLMIHIPHGAGDRDKGFEKRIALFDEVLVAGDKDRARMIALGLVEPEHCHATGSIKLAAMRRIGGNRPLLFTDTHPVILYNPHFDPRLASWEAMLEPLVAAVLANERYNLVIAPHARLLAAATPVARARWEALAVPGRVLVDTGSERSIDMTYTLGTDIYCGDVSSQVYEFIAHPRPCIFIDAHGADWQGNPGYAMWQFGPVISPGNDFISAVDGAIASHHDFRALQETSVVAALGPDAAKNALTAPDAIDRAAALIARLVSGSSPSRR